MISEKKQKLKWFAIIDFFFCFIYSAIQIKMGQFSESYCQQEFFKCTSQFPIQSLYQGPCFTSKLSLHLCCNLLCWPLPFLVYTQMWSNSSLPLFPSCNLLAFIMEMISGSLYKLEVARPHLVNHIKLFDMTIYIKVNKKLSNLIIIYWHKMRDT